MSVVENELQDRGLDLTGVGGIKFIEDKHIYLNSNGVRYTSPTTVLKDFKEPFDGDGISSYKSIKDITSSVEMKVRDPYTDELFDGTLFDSIKASIIKIKKIKRSKKHIAWKFVHLYWNSILTKTKYKTRLLERKQFYLDEWEQSALDGSIEHNKREQDIYKNGYNFRGKNYKFLNKNIFEITKDDVGVIPEMLLWNHDSCLGGLVDVPIFDKGVVYIDDFKTNKKIEKNGFDGKKMKKFLSHLPDCNLVHYSIQLELYLNMILMLRPDFKRGEDACTLISTKSVKYDRPNDIHIPCLELENEAKEIFNYLKTTLKGNGI